MTKSGTDNLEDYLAPYSEKEIEEIRKEKMQLVTASEFTMLHKEKLILENKLESAIEVLKKIAKSTEQVKPGKCIVFTQPTSEALLSQEVLADILGNEDEFLNNLMSEI